MSVADRAHKLAESHKDWILTQFAEVHTDLMSDSEWPMNIDDVIQTVHYGYLESAASPLQYEYLFDDEREDDNFYTPAFVDATYVAIEKLCL